MICGFLAAVTEIVYAASSAIVVKDIARKSLTFFSETKPSDQQKN
ncbi:MAG TPA: hypothetical protein VN827_10180 [Chthoniobacterales bacterium]|nr:hypothetical protein [Chthoniobacterales bacterium]